MKPQNILSSFPRSGNTWLRFIVEYTLKPPTEGYVQNNIFWHVDTPKHMKRLFPFYTKKYLLTKLTFSFYVLPIH